VVDLAMGYVQRRDTCELHCSVYQNRGVAHDKPARESTRQNIEKEFSREKRATMIICFLPFRPSWHQLPWRQPPSYRRRLLPSSYDEMKPCNEAKKRLSVKMASSKQMRHGQSAAVHFLLGIAALVAPTPSTNNHCTTSSPLLLSILMYFIFHPSKSSLHCSFLLLSALVEIDFAFAKSCVEMAVEIQHSPLKICHDGSHERFVAQRTNPVADSSPKRMSFGDPTQ
jgi:hypothetical protein